MSRPALEQAVSITLSLRPCQCGAGGVEVEIETSNSTTSRSEHLSEAAIKHLYAEVMKVAGTAVKMCDEEAPKNRVKEAAVKEQMRALFQRSGAAPCATEEENKATN